MKSIKVCEYSRSFHYDLILQDQASGERSQDQWSSGYISEESIAVVPRLVFTPYCCFFGPLPRDN